MSAEPIGPQADVDSVVRYLADLSERIRTMQEEADRYRAWLATQLPNGTHHIAGLKVFVQTSRRFDATYAAKILPAEWIERVSRPVVDRALAEALLPPDLYRTCQIEGKRSVRLT